MTVDTAPPGAPIKLPMAADDDVRALQHEVRELARQASTYSFRNVSVET